MFSLYSLKAIDLSADLTFGLNFMENYTNYSELSRTFYKEYLPKEILHLQQSLCINGI